MRSHGFDRTVAGFSACLLSGFSTPRLERLFLWEPAWGTRPIIAEMVAEIVARIRASPLGRRLKHLEVPKDLIEDPESLYEPETYWRGLPPLVPRK